MKKVIITGLNSYVGGNLVQLLKQHPNQYDIKLLSLRDEKWKDQDFSQYDAIVHVAGIVHQKKGKVSKDQYFTVNAELTRELAIKAKSDGVKQFIFLSTMSVYGEVGSLIKTIRIDKETTPEPNNFYGESKLLAEKYLYDLESGNFKVYVMRPPMVYGEGCPGNYTLLKKLSRYTPVFPLINNERSAIHINRLVTEIKAGIDWQLHGLSLPQDDEYINTSQLISQMAQEEGKKIYLSKLLGDCVKLSFKKVSIVNKIFGNLTYEKENINQGELKYARDAR